MIEFPLPSGIQALVVQIKAHSALDPSRARDLLAAAEIQPEELEPWSDFGHPRTESYGHKRIYDGGDFVLEVMSWIDGDMSAIHDHVCAKWGAVRCFGPAEHAVFRLEDSVFPPCSPQGDSVSPRGEETVLRTSNRQELAAGTTVAVSHDLIYQLGNVGQEPFLTLHLYGCPGRKASISATRIYELDGGKIQSTEGGAFFALPEAEVSRRQDAPAADFPTVLRHKVELLKRLLARHDSYARGSFQSEDEERLAAELFDGATWQHLADEWNRIAEYPSARLVLQHELRATADLQKQLLDAALVEPVLHGMRLAETLAVSNDEYFADAYLELIGDSFDVDLAVAHAA